MFYTRKQMFYYHMKKLGEALVGGFLLALPFMFIVLALALGM